jgi:hypothetical protein
VNFECHNAAHLSLGLPRILNNLFNFVKFLLSLFATSGEKWNEEYYYVQMVHTNRKRRNLDKLDNVPSSFCILAIIFRKGSVYTDSCLS